MPWTKTLSAALLLALSATGCAADDDPDRVLSRDDVGVMSRDMELDQANIADMAEMADTAPSDVGETPDLSGFCTPDRDGIITRDEVPIQAGLNAKFAVATDVDFDTAGEMVDGTRVWDLAQAFSGDSLMLVELRDPEGLWFASVFPNADYASRLTSTEEQLGVFAITDDALLLQGIVSPEDGLSRTEFGIRPAGVDSRISDHR